MTVEINNLNEPNKVNITTTSQKITVVDLVKEETTVVTPPPEETKIITVGIPGPRGHTGLISGSNIHVHHITASGNISASSGGSHYIGNLEVNNDNLGTAKITKFIGNQFMGDAAQWVAGGFPGFGHGNTYFKTVHGNTPGFHFLIDGALNVVSAGSQSKAYFRIEKSGNVPDVGTTIFNVDFYGNLTSSGNLNILGGGIHTIDGHLLVNGKIKSIGSDVTLENGHITASGNISASSLILGSETLNSTLLSNLALGLSSTESPETGRKKLKEIEFIVSGSNTKKVTLLEGDITASGKILGQEAQFGDSTIFLDGPNGHITASGNISASGNINAAQFQSHDKIIGLYHGSSDTVRLASVTAKTRIDGTDIKLDGPVTASGNISASGELYAGDKLYLDNNEVLSSNGDTLVLNKGGQFTSIGIGRSNQVVPINLYGNVTASGNISSSVVNALTGSFDVLEGNITEETGLEVSGYGLFTNITSSNNISASGALTSNTLKIDGSQVDFTGLPTSDPSVAGRLWNSGSYVKVSAG